MILTQICNYCKKVLDEYEGDTRNCFNKVHYCADCIDSPDIKDDFFGRLLTEDEKEKLYWLSFKKEERKVLLAIQEIQNERQKKDHTPNSKKDKKNLFGV